MTKSLASCAAGLELLAIPAWVLEPEQIRMIWVNEPAAQLWGAVDRAALLARDFSDISPSMRARVARQATEARAGRSLIEQTTFYPLGSPVTVTTHTSGLWLEDGAFGMLVQVVEQNRAPDADLVRGIEALRHTDTPVAMVTFEGELLMRNPAALRAFGDAPFRAWFAEGADGEEALSLLQEAKALGSLTTERRARTTSGERIHRVDIHVVRDPLSGESVALVQQLDETARTVAEEAAAEEARTVARQREEILALSVPILDVGEGKLALPLIGVLDEERAALLVERLLPAIVARRTSSVLLDLTGVEQVDEGFAGRLLQITRTVRLLGARVALTGIRADAAQAISASGEDLGGVLTHRNLRDALEAQRRR
ncbi:STAS domain-containing protein [Chondromyces crocatus]|uniref:Anti-anti sigma factor protein n=1 Tax=Chondromyces crocatus TaxID=52 RepID=A0A0K1EML9_CHOCO|nr:STAS domain-containing protein [Chondromyces crocatus]AKT42150.1 anti-anti sigma factor protein [Chondromyces crocatus]